MSFASELTAALGNAVGAAVGPAVEALIAPLTQRMNTFEQQREREWREMQRRLDQAEGFFTPPRINHLAGNPTPDAPPRVPRVQHLTKDTKERLALRFRQGQLLLEAEGVELELNKRAAEDADQKAGVIRPETVAGHGGSKDNLEAAALDGSSIHPHPTDSLVLAPDSPLAAPHFEPFDELAAMVAPADPQTSESKVEVAESEEEVEPTVVVIPASEAPPGLPNAVVPVFIKKGRTAAPNVMLDVRDDTESEEEPAADPTAGWVGRNWRPVSPISSVSSGSEYEPEPTNDSFLASLQHHSPRSPTVPIPNHNGGRQRRPPTNNRGIYLEFYRKGRHPVCPRCGDTSTWHGPTQAGYFQCRPCSIRQFRFRSHDGRTRRQDTLDGWVEV